MEYNLIGIIFIIYGIIKISLVLSLVFIPPIIKEKLATIEGVNYFVSGDNTLAGKMYEYVLLTFAVFSIIHGLTLMNVFPNNFRHFIEQKSFQYPFYIFLGLWLFVFYGFVIYTSIPISKNTKEMHNYKIYAYMGGLSFLLVPLVWEMIEHYNPYLQHLREEIQLAYITLIILGLLLITFATYIIIKRLKLIEKARSYRSEYLNRDIDSHLRLGYTKRLVDKYGAASILRSGTAKYPE